MTMYCDDRIVCYCLSRYGKIYLTLSPEEGERIDKYVYPHGTKAEVLINSREHGSRWDPVYVECARDWYENGPNEFVNEFEEDYYIKLRMSDADWRRIKKAFASHRDLTDRLMNEIESGKFIRGVDVFRGMTDDIDPEHKAVYTIPVDSTEYDIILSAFGNGNVIREYILKGL